MKTFLVGPQPPPVHGLATVNAALKGRITARGGKAIVIDVASPSLGRAWFARLARVPRILRGLARFAVSARPGDCLYMSVSGGAGQVYETAFAAWARARGVRCFLHHHSYAYLGKPYWLTRVLAAMAGPTAVHVALSPGMSERLRALYPSMQQHRAVSNLGWLERIEAGNASLRRTCATLGFLGNISAEKGVFDFLELAADLQALGCPITCKLAGPFQDADTERRVRELLRRLPNVDYVGPRYGYDKSAFLKEIDVLIFPTRYGNEAEPLTVLEAMTHGVPVIAYGRGCIGEVLSPGGGLVIEPQRKFSEIALRQISAWREAPEALWRASRAAIRRSGALRIQGAEDAEALLEETSVVAAGRQQNLRDFSVPAGFRGRPAWFVQLWWLVEATAFRWSPQVLYGWRRWLLRAFGASIGAGVLIRPTARVTYPWKLTVGDWSWIGDDVVLYSLGPIRIGSHCVVSQRCYLCTGTHDYRRASFDILAAPIEIQDQSWLAADVFVAPGITVGAGAVVGARSSVFSDVPAEVLSAGNPATRIRKRSAHQAASAVQASAGLI
jgi:putative colanic acid biosynthesis acetyltransferase WcaF